MRKYVLQIKQNVRLDSGEYISGQNGICWYPCNAPVLHHVLHKLGNTLNIFINRQNFVEISENKTSWWRCTHWELFNFETHRLTGNHRNLESTEKSKSSVNLESTERNDFKTGVFSEEICIRDQISNLHRLILSHQLRVGKLILSNNQVSSLKNSNQDVLMMMIHEKSGRPL